MQDEVTQIASWAAGGGSAGLAFFAARWAMVFLADRYDKREAALDSGTQRHIDRLEKQIDDLLERVRDVETSLEECQKKHAESEQERAQLRGLLQGYGDAKQVAQLIIAEEKRKDAK